MWMLSMVLLAIGQGPSAGLINLPASSAPSHDDRLKKSDELSIGVHASLVRVVPSDISNILIMGTFGGYCVMGNWLAFEQGGLCRLLCAATTGACCQQDVSSCRP